MFTFHDDLELVTAYNEALRSLYRELVPNHARFSELYFGLWELLRKIVSKAETYPETASLQQPLDRFAEKHKPPLVQCEVAFTIEFLDLGSHSIVIDQVTFVTPDESVLTEIGFPLDQWKDRLLL